MGTLTPEWDEDDLAPEKRAAAYAAARRYRETVTVPEVVRKLRDGSWKDEAREMGILKEEPTSDGVEVRMRYWGNFNCSAPAVRGLPIVKFTTLVNA